jgi:hypothetical protein
MPAAWELLQQEPLGKQSIGTATTVAPPQAVAGQRPENKLAIIIPHTGEVSSEWCFMFRDLQLPPGCQFFASRGMPIDVTRSAVTHTVLDAGFEWLFFLDSDVIPPRDVLQMLFSHQLPIVSGLYRAKKPDLIQWAAWMRGKDPNGKEAFLPVANWSQRLFKVDVVGMGCILVHRKVFDTIREKTDLPFFFWSKERNPALLDKMGIPDPLMREVSEDFWFLLLAKQYGFDTVCDGDIKCGHITVTKLTEKTRTLPSV